MIKNDSKYYTVGEIARLSGVTVRTLQYYDKCGLLSPSQYTEGGRRLYGWNDLIRMQQVLFLKTFGFSLDEIQQRMRIESSKAFGAVLEQQREVLNGQIKNMQAVLDFMDKVIDEIRASGDVGTEQLVAIMEMMRRGNPYSFIMRYFNSDQIRKLSGSSDALNPLGNVSSEWQLAFDELVVLYRTGVDPVSDTGQRFVAHWWDMVMKTTGGDPNLIKSLMNMGDDVDHWPNEVEEFKQAIKEFMAVAFKEFFSTKQREKEGDKI